FLVMRFLRSRREQQADGPVPAHARMGGQGAMGGRPVPGGPIPGMAGGSVASPSAAPSDKIGVTGADFDLFERRLQEVQ
ncbi:hypothetical protein ABTH81_22955, partial [Acinetobacter baumannii]